MTPDELYAKGYALRTSTWGVHIIYEDADHMNDDADIKDVITLHFSEPTSFEKAKEIGWAAAEQDFVKRRLE